MSPYRRNVLVGATVIGSCAVLGWMLLKFGSAPASLLASNHLINVQMISDRGDGLSEGGQVYFKGVSVGSIVSIQRSANGEDVDIAARIDTQPALPANVIGEIRTNGIVGGQASVSLEQTDPLPQGTLANGARIITHFQGSQLLPPEFSQLVEQMHKTNLILHVDESVRQAGDVMKSLNQYVGDPTVQANFHQSLDHIRQASETADRITSNLEHFSGRLDGIADRATGTVDQANAAIAQTQGHIDDLSRQLGERMQQLSKLLDGVNSITAKLDAGKGSAGQFINDNRLYESLVATSKELNGTVADLQRLLQQWEQEGVSLHLR